MTAAARPRTEIVARLREIGLIPVIRADSAHAAIRVAETLADAGIPVAEITMTVPDAVHAIATVARQHAGRILVGAGTVTHSDEARAAIDAGAEFVVTPSFTRAVVRAATRAGVTVLAGALTPTEVLDASRSGADFVKVFPVQCVGGPAYIRALRGPFPDIPLVPTGGVNLETVGDFIRAGSAALGVGGELVLRDALARGDYDAIGVLAGRFVDAVRAARVPRME